MLIERHMMNVLFFAGIILPTIVTVVLFVLFLLCWRRIKARKDIVNKLYDPHKKMRDRGVSRVPPPPPIFVNETAPQFEMMGEENTGYDVSRSPSTEQDERGRPLYHAPHDSGLSDVSNVQCKDRPHSQASQGSTDSEDSGFRSSRSGQFVQKGSSSNQLQDAPLLKSIKSNKDSPQEVIETPRGEKACVRNLSPALLSRKWSPASLNMTEQLPPKVDVTDISTHISWMYLSNLGSPTSEHASASTTAQIHPNNHSAIRTESEMFGFSVV